VIKILHTADLHLDSPLKSLALRDEALRDTVQLATRTALARLVQYGIDEGVSALLIAGDLFDGKERSAKTAAFLIAQLERLRAAGIAVFYIKGNHDAENPAAGAFDLPANTHVFDGRGGKVQLEGTDIWIHGVSFRDKHAPESLLPKYAGPVEGAVNIGMMHTSLAGAAGHDPYAPCTPGDLAAHGFDYWALGHVHSRAVHGTDPWIVMPGTPQGRDIGEAGQKSATLLRIEGTGLEGSGLDGSGIAIEEVLVGPVAFHHSTCDLTRVELADLRATLAAHLRAEAAASKSDATILRLHLTGQSALAWQLRRDADVWTETIHELARDTGCLWVEAVRIDVSEPPQTAASPNAVTELAQIMRAIRAEEGFATQARAELDEMIALLPPERRQALAPDEAGTAALLDEITDQAAQAMLARMKGAVG